MGGGKLSTGYRFVVLLSRTRSCNLVTVIPSICIFCNRMEKEPPPNLEDWDFDTSSTDDKIQAYEAVANAYHAGTQPAIFLTQFPTRQPHSPGGGLPVGELGPDPWAVLTDRPDVNGQHNRCSVGEMGAAQRMDHVGTGHPAQTLSSQLDCGIVQGRI